MITFWSEGGARDCPLMWSSSQLYMSVCVGQPTELACFLAWLISSLICEMFRLKLSCSFLIGCSFSSNLSASSSKSFTLAPAAWTEGSKRRSSAVVRGSNGHYNGHYTVWRSWGRVASSHVAWQIIADEEKADCLKKMRKCRGRARRMEKPMRAEQLEELSIQREPSLHYLQERKKNKVPCFALCRALML